MFDKYLLLVLQFLSRKQGKFIQVVDIFVQADIPLQYADAIENELIKKEFVFATEESGVMINDNGLTFLAKQELLLKDASKTKNFQDSPSFVQKQNRFIKIAIKLFKWIFNHIIQIIIGLIVAYFVYRLRWTQ